MDCYSMHPHVMSKVGYVVSYVLWCTVLNVLWYTVPLLVITSTYACHVYRLMLIIWHLAWGRSEYAIQRIKMRWVPNHDYDRYDYIIIKYTYSICTDWLPNTLSMTDWYPCDIGPNQTIQSLWNSNSKSTTTHGQYQYQSFHRIISQDQWAKLMMKVAGPCEVWHTQYPNCFYLCLAQSSYE